VLGEGDWQLKVESKGDLLRLTEAVRKGLGKGILLLEDTMPYL